MGNGSEWSKMAQWGHEKNDGRWGAFCSQACRPLSEASHRWKRDPEKGPLSELIRGMKLYETPTTYPPSRGNVQGLSPQEQDVLLLERLVSIVRPVHAASVAPHPSVLHKKYKEIETIADPNASCGSCPEAEWMRAALKAAESPEARRKVAGGLSVMQFRGTGEYWDIFWRHVRRRLAEKAMCAVRELQELRSAMLKLHSCSKEVRDLQNKRLAVLARLLALDEEIAVGFMKNGYDALNKQFVRCPDLDEAQRFLQAMGAPLNFVPRPIRMRMQGMKLEINPLL